VLRSVAKQLLLGHNCGMYFVYVLKSACKSNLYVGFTENIKKRISEHNNGKVTSTKNDKPWLLIFFECYANKNDALRRERYFKTTIGKRSLKLMLKTTLAEDSSNKTI
jgi:putative endonuclease